MDPITDSDVSLQETPAQGTTPMLPKETFESFLESKGIGKEQARSILPEGNTVCRMYVNGTLRSWVHFIEVRSGNGTQKEHMEIAKEIACAIAEIFPMAGDFICES